MTERIAMTMPPPRRPRFLASVPETPAPTPAHFAQVGPRPPPKPAPRDPVPARDPAQSAAELASMRREAMEKVKAAVETLRAQAERLAEQSRSDAIEIAFLVAKRILETELKQNPEALFSLVRTAVRKVGESRRVTVRIAPEDAEVMQSDAGRVALEGVTSARIEFAADASLRSGDCLVDADLGQVDGRIAARLAELRRAIDTVDGGSE